MSEQAQVVSKPASSFTGRRLTAQKWAGLLFRDKFAFGAACFLLFIVLCAVFGPALVGQQAVAMNLGMRNAPPFNPARGFFYFLGADVLGRSIIARLVVASRDTIAIAAGVVFCSLFVGTLLGLIAGLRGGWVDDVLLRMADLLMGLPSLLLAVVVLYILQPGVENLILILAITRIPIYLRTTRAETLEVRERMFVLASRVMASSRWHIIRYHLLPVIMPTLVTLATLEFAFVMLAESSLSFLGVGLQSPDVSWGLMVAAGRNYLGSAWWLSFWPGLMITLTATALNLLSNWMRIATDPRQRWRLEGTRDAPAAADDAK